MSEKKDTNSNTPQSGVHEPQDAKATAAKKDLDERARALFVRMKKVAKQNEQISLNLHTTTS